MATTGENLSFALKALGIGKKEFADLFGITPPLLSSYLTKEVSPKIEFWRKVSEFGISLDFVIGNYGKLLLDNPGGNKLKDKLYRESGDPQKDRIRKEIHWLYGNYEGFVKAHNIEYGKYYNDIYQAKTFISPYLLDILTDLGYNLRYFMTGHKPKFLSEKVEEELMDKKEEILNQSVGVGDK
jgi:transcriptional regulator with XRE-family HTH domain